MSRGKWRMENGELKIEEMLYGESSFWRIVLCGESIISKASEQVSGLPDAYVIADELDYGVTN